MTVTEAFGNLADVLADMHPQKIAALKSSPAMSARVAELIAAKKNGVLTAAENAELERFLGLDLFISLAKARAHKLLQA